MKKSTKSANKKPAAAKGSKAVETKVEAAAAPASVNGAAASQFRQPATAASILGFSPSPSRKRKQAEEDHFSAAKLQSIKAEWRTYYQMLLDLREQLVQQMHGLAKESAEEMDNYSLHMADSGTDNFDRDFALSLLSSDQDAVYEIEEALRRIEKETYGVCELTGKRIPKARLEAIPWTRFTVQAQAQLERDGAIRNKRLANLGSIDTGGSGTAEVEDDGDDDSRGRSKNKDS